MRYRLVTTWLLESPVEPVFWKLHDAEGWPSWWPGVRSVVKLEAGDALGVGSLGRYAWRSRLPYDLTFEVRTTRVEPPHLLSGDAGGHLTGTGTWRLYERDGLTAVVYLWEVATTRRWMNMLGPLARPAFIWNHDAIMRRGGAGLSAALGVQLVAGG